MIACIAIPYFAAAVERRSASELVEKPLATNSEEGEKIVTLMRDAGVTVVTQPGFIYQRGDQYLIDVEPQERELLYRCRVFLDAELRPGFDLVAEILDLTPYLNKRAAGLAADAKQKISLGRGLVRSDVAAILFDEPLTVIDPHLKWNLRHKLKEIHQQLKLTLIYVTHDQVEALTMADRIGVLNEGQLVFDGLPHEIDDQRFKDIYGQDAERIG